MKNNSDNKLIVQFSHPGAEYIPYKKREDPNIVFDNSLKVSGRRKWNNLKSHKRKFIQSIGNFANIWIASNFINIQGSRQLKLSCIMAGIKSIVYPYLYIRNKLFKDYLMVWSYFLFNYDGCDFFLVITL